MTAAARPRAGRARLMSRRPAFFRSKLAALFFRPASAPPAAPARSVRRAQTLGATGIQ